MSDVNDLASSLFGTRRAEVAGGLTSTVYGTATSDSSGGSVSVRMGADTLRADGQAGTSVLVPTTTDVRAGETVIVTVVDGHPVVTGVVGSGDRLRTDVDAAAGVADLARQDVTKAQAEIDQFRKDAEATYSTKTETDEKTNAVKETIEATYLKKDDASTTYATKTELAKSADGIRSEVSEEYVTKDDAAKAYVGKSTFEQDSRKIATTVTSELTTGWTAWADDSTGKNMVLGNTYPGAKTAPGGTEHPVDVDGMAFIGSAKVLSESQPTDAKSYDWIPNSTKTMRTRIEQTSDRVDAAITDIDGISTLIRQDSTGITVGKSADGKTYSTGRTHMDEDSFDVLDKAGTILSSFGASLLTLGTKAAAILLAGILRVESLQTHPATAGGSQLTVDTGRISVPVHAETGAQWSAIEIAGRDDATGKSTPAIRAEFSVSDNDGSVNPYVFVDCGMTVAGTMVMASKAAALDTRGGLRITQGTKVCHGHGTPWVTLFDTWADFQAATGCYGSSTPTLVTMNGDWNAFDGTLSGCEIRGGYPVYVLAQTTGGLPNISSSQALRINWICIW